MNVPLFTTSPTASPTQPLHSPYTAPTAPTKTQAKRMAIHTHPCAPHITNTPAAHRSLLSHRLVEITPAHPQESSAAMPLVRHRIREKKAAPACACGKSRALTHGLFATLSPQASWQAFLRSNTSQLLQTGSSSITRTRGGGMSTTPMFVRTTLRMCSQTSSRAQPFGII